MVIKDKEQKTEHKDKIEKVKPLVSGCGGLNFRQLSKGEVRVDFDKDDYRDSVLAKVTDELPSFVAEVSNKANPQLILKGIHKSFTEDCTDTSEMYKHFFSELKRKNGVVKKLVGNGELDHHFHKVVRIEKNRNGDLRNVVIEVSPKAHKELLSTDTVRLNIGWQRVHAAHHSRFVQCFKCHGFGHITRFCKETEDMWPLHGQAPNVIVSE